MTTPREKLPSGTTSGLRPVAGKEPPAGPSPSSPPPAAGHKYLAGDVINRKYRLTQVLGEGGMGAVWMARNVILDVDVAIKLIRRDVATLETSQRLLQEARAAARLRHPSIVRVFDFGETEHSDPFIVMEVLRGDSFADVLGRRGRLPAVEAVRILLPIASALVAAHAQGIVHRDLKPENIILVAEGEDGYVPKVVDFGIAKLREENVDGSITLAGSILGSPDYMSPEQARGRDAVDERTDIWSLCVVLYEAISGNIPFEAPNYNALLTTILNDEPVPTVDFAAGDAALWEIIKRGLQKDPEARWPTMRALGGALAEWVLERDHDTDVAGTSLVAHWTRHSLHGAPSSRRSGAGVATIRPSPVIALETTSLAPRPSSAAFLVPSRPAPRRRRIWVFAAIAFAIAGGGAALYLGRPAPRVADAPAQPIPPTPAAAIPPAETTPETTAAPTATATAAESAPPAVSTPRPPPAPRPGAPSKHPLEIPNNPNF